MSKSAALVAALLVVLVVAGCDGGPPPGADAEPGAGGVPASTGSGSPPTSDSGVPEPVDDPLVVVGHATRPQLRLTAAEAAELVSRRGTGDVVSTVRAVERDPDAVGVVPLSR